MSQEREMPRPGDFYRHFKDKLYQIITIAVHSETGDSMVVYQALYGDFKTWVRPLSMFLEETDREKYPDAKQRYRFEKVRSAELTAEHIKPDADKAAGAAPDDAVRTENLAAPTKESEPQVNPFLDSFLEADEYREKLECLSRMNGHVTQRDLDLIYVVMDMKPQAGDLKDQLRAVRNQLLMLQKYDGERLR